MIEDNLLSYLQVPFPLAQHTDTNKESLAEKDQDKLFSASLELSSKQHLL